MSGNLEGFEQWRDGIEARVGTLESIVGTEARLRAEMDQDMSDLKVEFRVQRNLLQALATTQSEHTVRLTRLEAGQARLEAGQARLEGGQARLEGGQAQLEAGQARLEGRQAQLEAGQAQLEAGQARLEAGQAEVLVGVKAIIGLLDGTPDSGGC